MDLPRDLGELEFPLPQPTTLEDAQGVIAAMHLLIHQQHMTKQSQLNLIHVLNDRLLAALKTQWAMLLVIGLLTGALILSRTHVI